jgi:O-antigen/teichoic acid export membrane protein
MKSRIINLLRTATLRQSAVTTIGTVINGILGALFYILAAKFLGAVDFGILSVSIVTLTLIADIADLGTNTGLVKFVSQSIKENRDKAYKYLKLSLEIKFAVWVLIMALGLLLSDPLAVFVFQKPELQLPLKLVVVGVGGALLFSFATSSLQAFQKYKTWSLVNIIANGLRLLSLMAIFYVQLLDLTNSILVYIFFPFFAFFLSSIFLPLDKIITTRNEFSVGRTLFHYNKWVALMTLVSALSARLDTYLSTRLLTLSEVGVYSLANQLTTFIPQIVGSLGVVVAPKFASFTNIKDMLIYFKKLQLMVIIFAILCLLALPLSHLIIPIYLPQYVLSIPIFSILLIAMLVFLVSVPVHNSIFYYFGRPSLFVWISLGHLLIVVLLGYYMIQNYRLVGAAVTVLIGQIFGLIVPLVWFLFRIKQK